MDNSIFCTNCEPIEARTMLPCLDEPCYKAVFNLSVKVNNPAHIAISNTPIRAKHDSLVQFEPTPKMSTYLLVCVVGRFENIEVEPSKDGVKVGGYTPVGYTK